MVIVRRACGVDCFGSHELVDGDDQSVGRRVNERLEAAGAAELAGWSQPRVRGTRRCRRRADPPSRRRHAPAREGDVRPQAGWLSMGMKAGIGGCLPPERIDEVRRVIEPERCRVVRGTSSPRRIVSMRPGLLGVRWRELPPIAVGRERAPAAPGLLPRVRGCDKAAEPAARRGRRWALGPTAPGRRSSRSRCVSGVSLP